ncbi:hypothetical protein [Vibrio pectenicida]|uniref:HNH endonuclease n=1 Tax=Vibrio pectenicida TaxID=62763 RepID=A0A3R9FMU7_9VIBR|nr:hypothetical protein [Vibrio pectenicida]RSD31706.1 hypothetical protein EJA03_07185 [Vibrio pectenicida]
MTSNRFCVFCGNLPDKKTREHILPQWLLELTGDPKRVVNFGTNFENGRTIRFDWSNFCVPACEICNTEYSNLESRAKPYVLKLLARDSLTSIEYVDFMDWMDKVRVGLWIQYHFIQGNPTNIQPSFHINTRIGQKDRMIAIYPLEGDGVGLNALGAESLIFHSQPSCMGLRINNILIMNMSSDFLFSGRCGFPFPKSCFTMLDGENPHMMHTSDFSVTRKIKHPLIRKQIFKPSIHLYQPIMSKSEDKRFQSGFLGDVSIFDSYLAKHTLSPYPSGKGILYFQHLDRVEPLYDINQPIEFESCTGIHSKPMYTLVQQIYEFQNFIYKKGKFLAEERELERNHEKRTKLLLKWNNNVIAHYSKRKNS